MNNDIDFSDTIKSKSDQLNAIDVIGGKILKIVDVTRGKDEKQPMFIHWEGGQGTPWKPSLGMRRILRTLWGSPDEQGETTLKRSDMLGKTVKVFCKDEVVYAGQEVGGIWIEAMSHIQKEGYKTIVKVNRTKKLPIFVGYFEPQATHYNQAQFDIDLPKMREAISSGNMTLNDVIEHCRPQGEFTPEQLAQLK
jgi:hypothetical protein